MPHFVGDYALIFSYRVFDYNIIVNWIRHVVAQHTSFPNFSFKEHIDRIMFRFNIPHFSAKDGIPGICVFIQKCILWSVPLGALRTNAALAPLPDLEILPTATWTWEW